MVHPETSSALDEMTPRYWIIGDGPGEIIYFKNNNYTPFSLSKSVLKERLLTLGQKLILAREREGKSIEFFPTEIFRYTTESQE